jgi:hypothetical protein
MIGNQKQISHNIFSMCHCGFAIYMKEYLKAKEKLWKFQYFTMQKHIFKQNPLKETKLLQDIITSSLIPSFNTSHIIFQKPSYKNRPTTWGPKSIKLLYFIMNLNTISLPW